MPETNGTQTLTWKWLAGILIVVILALVGSWAATLQSRVNAQEVLMAQRGERITMLEGRATLLEQRFSFIDQRLADIIEGQREISASLMKHREATK